VALLLYGYGFPVRAYPAGCVAKRDCLYQKIFGERRVAIFYWRVMAKIEEHFVD